MGNAKQPAFPVPPSPVSAFISYARGDEHFLDEFIKRLMPLERDGLLKTWHDQQIEPGDDWQKKIAGGLAKSDLVFLLISANFMASDYCYNGKFEYALEHQKLIVPILTSPEANWTKSPIAGFQALPKNGIPITKWQLQDEACANIVESIRQFLRKEYGMEPMSNEPSAMGPESTEESTQDIELKIDRDFEEFSDREQEQFLDAVKSLLVIGDLHVVRKDRGCVRLTLRLSRDDADDLLMAVERGKLHHLGVTEAKLGPAHPRDQHAVSESEKTRPKWSDKIVDRQGYTITTLEHRLSSGWSGIRRTLRVFVSSTFTDMRAERDELAIHVFPRLRRLCEARAVSWDDVDLRWGITNEQRAEGQVLPICLDEIKKCRPFFIAILGERYGWDKLELSDDLLNREPWLGNYPNCSVTELEILHAINEREDIPLQTRFYFREPEFVSRIPKEERQQYVETARPEEVAEFGAEKAEELARSRANKLRELKRRITRIDPRLHPPYRNPRELGDLVAKDFSEILDMAFPAPEARDPGERERTQHEAVAWSHAEVSLPSGHRQGAYVVRPELGKLLDDHIEGDDPPLVITGPAGIGKTALLANWILRYEQAHGSHHILFHSIGASPASSTAIGIVGRLLNEIGSLHGMSLPSSNLDDRATGLQVALGMFQNLSSKEQFVLVLDGLDKLEGRDEELDLEWLPQIFPANVRVLISASAGRALEALNRRNWRAVDLSPLSNDERLELILRCLSSHGRTLEKTRLENIAGASSCALPLFLRVLLDEIRLVDSDLELDYRIAEYLQAKTVTDLFSRVLQRYTQVYDRDRPHLVAEAMQLLWASRMGLSDMELRDLLSAKDKPLPMGLWSPLRAAIGRSLIEREGTLAFAHRFLRDAVEKEFLGNASERRQVHSRLADYFDSKAGLYRRVQELPWQLAGAERWEHLARILSEPEMISGVGMIDERELRSYWTQIENNTEQTAEKAARNLLTKRSNQNVEVLATLQSMLWNQGHYEGSLDALEELIYRIEPKGESIALAMLLRNAADAHMRLGHDKKTLELLERARRINEKEDHASGLADCLRTESAYWSGRDEYGKGLNCAERSLEIAERLEDRWGTRIDLTNRALCLTMLGRLEEAREIHSKEEALARELRDWDGLTRSLNNQGNLHLRKAELERARELYREAELLARQYGNARSVMVSLAGQTQVLAAQDRFEEAYAMSEQLMSVVEPLQDPNALARAQYLQSAITARLPCKPAESPSSKLKRQNLRESEDVPKLLAAAASLVDRDCLKEALELIELARELAKEKGRQDQEALATADMAGILKRMRHFDEALDMIRASRELAEQSGDEVTLQNALTNEAVAIWEIAGPGNRSQLEKALALAERAIEISSKRSMHTAHAFVTGTRALILRFLDRVEEARESFQQSVESARRSNDAYNLARSLLNHATFCMEMGPPEQIEELIHEANELIDKVKDPEIHRQLEMIKQLRRDG